MIRYTGKRFLISLLSVWMLITVAFFLTRQMPGSPFQTGNVSGEVLEQMEQEYGLDQPVSVPVSYTHLDVYKRQDLKRPGKRGCIFRSRTSFV